MEYDDDESVSYYTQAFIITNHIKNKILDKITSYGKLVTMELAYIKQRMSQMKYNVLSLSNAVV
jgi:hypothetical protein